MSYTLLHEADRVARKPHDCIWCNEKIQRGETYKDERSVYDGEMQLHRWHPECQVAADKFFKESGECEFEAHACKRGTFDER